MSQSDNKIASEAMDARIESDCLAGHWPEVHFRKENGMTSRYLFEWGGVMNNYRLAMHLNLKQRGWPMGVLTVKRSKEWQAVIAQLMADMRIVGSADLVAGQRVRLYGMREMGRKDRIATVVQDYEDQPVVYMPCIFDIQMTEENGYFDDRGSTYVWEVRILEVQTPDGRPVWCPFECTAEERKFRDEVQGGDAGAAAAAETFMSAAGM